VSLAFGYEKRAVFMGEVRFLSFSVFCGLLRLCKRLICFSNVHCPKAMDVFFYAVATVPAARCNATFAPLATVGAAFRE